MINAKTGKAIAEEFTLQFGVIHGLKVEGEYPEVFTCRMHRENHFDASAFGQTKAEAIDRMFMRVNEQTDGTGVGMVRTFPPIREFMMKSEWQKLVL